MFVGVIGSGSWGTALAQVLVDNGVKTLIWGRDPEEVENININHKLKYFPDVILDSRLQATTDFSDLDKCDVLLIATPTKALESVINNINENFTSKKVIINVAKGFYNQEIVRISEAIETLIKPELLESIVLLVGPTHAEEVILRLETAIVSVSDNNEACHKIQSLFSNEYFRVYTSDDLVGAEIGSAIKNVIALASGIISGVGLGDNAQAALITRGLTEITRLGLAMGGKMDTFMGLTGVGDLIVTATSPHSRNYQAGRQIGEFGVGYFKENNKTTVEGARAVVEVMKLSKTYNISMPISEAVYNILYKDFDVKETIYLLMTRELKSESINYNR